jgi:hypothetical protein
MTSIDFRFIVGLEKTDDHKSSFENGPFKDTCQADEILDKPRLYDSINLEKCLFDLINAGDKTIINMIKR